ncbi:hypothetical protein ACIHFE_31520 [Streptomyces sp. NPDC052396]|uniref:hypothetical protein n=1 Tax=Streptomyces sp. NPDC052396 TaxID=3365689 RepID=UPI0037D5A9C7
MLAYLVPLWIAGVACLVAAAAGQPVKLGGAEIPAIPTVGARRAVAVIGVVAIALGAALFFRERPSSDGGSASGGSAGNPAPSHPARLPVDPPPPPRPATTEPVSPRTHEPPAPTATEPPASATPRTVGVRWHGTLTLDDGHTSGIPVTGWFLDTVPPQRAPLGDLGLACQLSCAPGEFIGNTIVAWGGSTPPKRQECVDLLNTNLGGRR